jgi:hypothetical protein
MKKPIPALPVVTMLIVGLFLLPAASTFADKAEMLPANPPGKPRAPLLMQWSGVDGQMQLAAELIPLADFEELVVRLVVPQTGNQYPEKRFTNGQRGETISVAWHELSSGEVQALPRLSVTMRVRGQAMSGSLAFPVRSSKSMGKLNVEMKRAHGMGRVEEKARVVVFPAAESMQP